MRNKQETAEARKQRLVKALKANIAKRKQQAKSKPAEPRPKKD
jgi:hypothetical protein